MADGEYEMVMKFLDGSESFCHGYEMGMLHMRMQAGEEIESHVVHAANKEQIEMLARSSIAARHNYALQWDESVDDGWIYLTATPATEPYDPREKFTVIPGGLA